MISKPIFRGIAVPNASTVNLFTPATLATMTDEAGTTVGGIPGSTTYTKATIQCLGGVVNYAATGVACAGGGLQLASGSTLVAQHPLHMMSFQWVSGTPVIRIMMEKA